MTAPSIRERVQAARQKEFISIEECALLVGCSTRTIWRRLPRLTHVIHDGHLVRVHRAEAMRVFLHRPPTPR